MINSVKILKLRNAAGPSEVNMEMLVASGKIGVEVMMK